jgi:hypothetical protein
MKPPRLFALLGYRLWWLARSPWGHAASDLPLVAIGGAPRSGTTLLRTILGRHPMMTAGPETTVFLQRVSSPADLAERLGWEASVIEAMQWRSRSQAEFIERFAATALQRSGKSVWVEKTPHNVLRFGFIRRHFPRAKLVHLVRDGRDVICSLRREPFSKIGNVPWDSQQAALSCARQWRAAILAGSRFRRDPACHELRYEDLVQNPEPTLRALLTFLDLPWDEALLRPAAVAPSTDPHEFKAASAIETASIGRWRNDLDAAALRALEPLIGPLLRDLGYD